VHLEVVTPKGVLLDHDRVDQVVAPGLLGEVGILPAHIPFLTALRPGVLRWKGQDAEGVLAVGSGYLEVTTAGRVIVLCDVALDATSVQLTESIRELDQLEQQLATGTPAPAASAAGHGAGDASRPDAATAALHEQRDWARARIMAAKWTE
jgi:F-type H+-transporting ATPase subunit epsilon